MKLMVPREGLFSGSAYKKKGGASRRRHLVRFRIP
jgi:hypothetical protein